MALNLTDAAIFYNSEEIVEILLGSGRALAYKLQESLNWDSLVEELDISSNFKTLEEIEEATKEAKEMKLHITYNVPFKART